MRKRGKPMRKARRGREKRSRERRRIYVYICTIYIYIYSYVQRDAKAEGEGRRVSASRNRKPTTAGENASRYYSRTSKDLSSRSSGSFTFRSPIPSHPRTSFLRFRDSSRSGETFLCASRRTSELFEDMQERILDIYRSTSSSSDWV